MYEKYHEQVQFLSIYIREAHPVDGWWLGRRLTKNIMLKMAPKVSMEHYDPKTIEERRAVAGECETALQYGIHTYVDEIDDYVNDTYAAWPTRLYLIGTDGKPGNCFRVIFPVPGKDAACISFDLLFRIIQHRNQALTLQVVWL